jgi:diguanylate cyclase (GGDEF)-like protein/PAS domain S-box-containing protein
MAGIGTQLGRAIERRQAQFEREELRRRLEVLLESAGEGIWGMDEAGTTTFVNPAAAKMVGWPAEELIGRPMHDRVHCASAGSDSHPPERCPIVLRGREHGDGVPVDGVFSRRDGTSFPVEYMSTRLLAENHHGGIVVTFRDVTERRRMESQLQYLADHDALTGLFNRRRFEEELDRAVAYAHRYGTGGAALVLDLDSFKFVNDTLGHQAGDELIRSVAALLRQRLRDSDVLARLGGDEFAVLLPQADRGEAERVAGELVQALREHVVAFVGRPLRVTTSIGVALIQEQEEITGEELMVKADVAMYAAKDAGRDRLAVYTLEQQRNLHREAGLASSARIRRALDEDRFVLYQQPILDLTTNEISQFELLLRMRGDDDELLLPGAFLPSAERFGLIQEVDRWVVRAAIALLEDCRRAGREIELLVEINLSGKSMGDPALPRMLEQELASSSIDPSAIIFEITETAAIANMNDARVFAGQLDELGCRFALDDFGAGFGSFYYLKHLPLSYLKLDGEFIENLPRSPIDQRMVRAMVEVARGIGLKTIAEFVGDDETLALLREYGVDFAQGYHIGRPRPVEELRRR